MLRRKILSSLAVLAVLMVGVMPASAQSIAPAYDENDYDRARIDRYLDVEVWTGHSDGEYYEGDDIVVHFRVNRDAFVAIYSIDTRGRVNLLFPTYPDEDNYIAGGVTYSLPGGGDDYDLRVSGPEGFENIQVVASRERFPIPDWYHGPELVADWDNRDDYMDWVNSTHFVRYGGQRFAYDRAVIYVNEWEDDYFRPVYYPSYPSWTVYGNAYIDYPWGASIYFDGLYWGAAPLYCPRISVGWHTFTLYDQYGYGWEHDFHVSRYNTIVFDRTIIKTSPGIKSKYKEVRSVGYRNPTKYGYPNFEARKTTMMKASRKNSNVRGKSSPGTTTFAPLPKKHVRGSTKIVKTDRGYESDASTAIRPRKRVNRPGSTDRTQNGRSLSNKSKSSGSTSSSKGRTSYQPSSGSKSGRSTTSGRVGQTSSRKSGRTGSSRTGRVKSGKSTSKRQTSGSIKSRPSSTSSKKKPATVQRRKSSGKTSSGKIEKKSRPTKASSSDRKKEETIVKSTPKKQPTPKAKSSMSSGKKSGGKLKKLGKIR